MKKHFVSVVVLILLSVVLCAAQSRDVRLRTKGYVNPQEIVSLDSTMRFDQALRVLNELSKQYAGKIIIDMEKHTNPIGVYVVNQHWRDALDLICSRNGLTSVEEQDYIRIMQVGAASAAAAQGPLAPSEPPPTLDSRDIKISAVFFNTNLNKLQDYGISWNFFRKKNKEPEMTFYNSANIGRGDTTSPVPPVVSTVGGTTGGPSLDKAIAVLQSPPEFTFANLDALIKFFGSNNLGEVITSPEITVRDGKSGKIIVGRDFFITERDIAGNTVNQRIETGTIIDVKPTIYTQNDTDFVYLNLNVEQSDVEAGPTVNRTSVTTHALLYDGEETVIGGLYSTTDQHNREGIPVLKDLPWWFFGLRYVFGSDQTLKARQELIILLKAELIQPIRTRLVHKNSQPNLIEEKKKEHKKQFENN